MEGRRARAADLEVVVATLVESHLDYVWEEWAVAPPHRREKLTALVHRHVELIALPSREVWMSDDGAAVAIWHAHPTARVDTDASTAMHEIAREVYGARLAELQAVDAVLHRHRPSEPHHFLATMGVLPDRQRAGLGTAVLAPVLDDLDRTGTPACLETSSEGNVAFYATLGFGVLAFVDDLPSGAPATWVLWRPPAVP
jgi:GNAT superfamily N-acetyltransferase